MKRAGLSLRNDWAKAGRSAERYPMGKAPGLKNRKGGIEWNYRRC